MARISYVQPSAITDPELAASWFELFEGAGLDGLVIKALESPYSPGARTMLKLKHSRTADVVVAGWREHKTRAADGGPLMFGKGFDKSALDPMTLGLAGQGRRRVWRAPLFLSRLRASGLVYDRQLRGLDLVLSPVLTRTTPRLGELDPTLGLTPRHTRRRRDPLLRGPHRAPSPRTRTIHPADHPGDVVVAEQHHRLSKLNLNLKAER